MNKKARSNNYRAVRLVGLIIFAAMFIMSCDPNEAQNVIPDVPVDIEVDLSSIDNVELQQVGGYKYLNGGVRGIVLIRTSLTEFTALDRNCTYLPSNSKAIVSMHSSGFYLEDTTCNSNFNHSGFPTGGPAPFPLKEYNVSRSGDLLFILN